MRTIMMTLLAGTILSASAMANVSISTNADDGDNNSILWRGQNPNQR